MSARAAVRRDWGWLVALVGLLPALMPLARPGLPSVADATIHLFRTAEWVRIWQAGVIYPRWSPNLAFGYGFPLFIFAPPLPYVVAGSLHLLGLPLETAVKALPVLGFVLMALGAYLLVRDLFGPSSGVLAALAFAYAPFQLREAYLYGGNYPQFLAIALFPWVLWTFRRAALTGRLGWILAGGLTFAGLTLSHNFHALIFMPVVAAYVLGLALVERKRQAAVAALAAGSLGLALSAAFWIPALVERAYSPAQEAFYVARSDFRLRFLSWSELLAPPGPLDAGAANPYMPFALGWAIIALAVLGVVALFFARPLNRAARYSLGFFAALLAASTFMMMPVSALLWERVPLLATAEFPWRLMGLASLAVAVLAGASGCLLGRLGNGRLVAVGAMAIILGSSVYTYPPRAFTAFGTPSLADGVRYEVSTQTIGTTTLGEYVPIWVRQSPTSSPMVADYLAGRPIDKLDRSTLPADATAVPASGGAEHDEYRVSSAFDWTLRLNTFYYPGWSASIDGRPAEVRIQPESGLIEVPVPAGDHSVRLWFAATATRRAADLISLIAWIVMAACVAYLIAFRRARPTVVAAHATGRLASSACAYTLSAVLLWTAARAAAIDARTDWFRLHSPPGQVLSVQRPARFNFDNRAMLLGYELDGEPARPGGDLHVRLFWQALGPLEEDLSSFVHLDLAPDLVTKAQSDNVHPGDARAQIDVAARGWSSEQYVRDEHIVRLPAEMPPGAFALRVGLYDRAGRRLRLLDDQGRPAGDAAFLQVVHTLGDEPSATGGVEGRFEGGIELLAAAVPMTVAPPGQSLPVDLTWRTAQPVDRDYTVFVHLVNESGKPAAQADSQPAGGAYPTSWFLPGLAVADRHDVDLAGVPPGPYAVVVGLYEAQSGRRLQLAGGGGDHIQLKQTVEVNSTD